MEPLDGINFFLLHVFMAVRMQKKTGSTLSERLFFYVSGDFSTNAFRANVFFYVIFLSTMTLMFEQEICCSYCKKI